jgi:hypothetical protein
MDDFSDRFRQAQRAAREAHKALTRARIELKSAQRQVADCEARACDRAMAGEFDEDEAGQVLAAYATYDRLDAAQRRTREHLLDAFRRLSTAKRNANT